MKISSETRAELINLLANRYLDAQDTRSLEQFFYDATTESLSSCDDSELVEALENMVSEEEYTKILTEIANES
jgi:hypothetical protein